MQKQVSLVLTEVWLDEPYFFARDKIFANLE